MGYLYKCDGCGYTFDGIPEFELEWEGKLLTFCSVECLKNWLEGLRR